jgi:hypothetical protein
MQISVSTVARTVLARGAFVISDVSKAYRTASAPAFLAKLPRPLPKAWQGAYGPVACLDSGNLIFVALAV